MGKTGHIYVHLAKDTLSPSRHLDQRLNHLTRNNETSRLPFVFKAPKKSTFGPYPAWHAFDSEKRELI